MQPKRGKAHPRSGKFREWAQLGDLLALLWVPFFMCYRQFAGKIMQKEKKKKVLSDY